MDVRVPLLCNDGAPMFATRKSELETRKGWNP